MIYCYMINTVMILKWLKGRFLDHMQLKLNKPSLQLTYRFPRTFFNLLTN